MGLLKTGGLMKIGLYSELARRHIAMTREEISLQKVGTSEADIRQFRQSLIESHHKHHKSLTISLDFLASALLELGISCARAPVHATADPRLSGSVGPKVLWI